MAEYRELRRLAGEATPGPWVADDTSDMHEDYFESERSTGWFREGPGQVDIGDYNTLTAEDAAYIAAASPDVILALLDERERLLDELAFALGALNDPEVLGDKSKARIRALMEAEMRAVGFR